MKKLSAVIIAILLGIVTLFGVVGCGGADNSAYEKQITELQSKIEEMQNQLDEKEDSSDEIKDLLAEMLYSLDEKNGQLRDRDESIELLEKLLNGELPEGPFYTLKEAYYCDLLTKDDLEQIAYYINNELSTSQKLESSIEDSIKEAAADEIRNRKTEPVLDATADGFTIVDYYGVYSDCYVIRMRDIYDLHPTDIREYWKAIGGVQFHYFGYDRITVFRVNDNA